MAKPKRSLLIANIDENTRAYERLSSPNPSCCSACATFVEAVGGSWLPPEFVALINEAGADVRKPLEVWGVPEEGFLEGLYTVAGHLSGPPWAGEAEGAFEEPSPGFKYYVTEQISMTDEAFSGMRVLQVEFTWQSDKLKAIAERAVAVQ